MRLSRVLWAFLFVLLFGFGTVADAATMFPSPTSGEKTVGAVFSLKVYVESSSQAMNAAGATLSFPTDILEVVSVSREDSIINLWIQEPTFSNTYGTVKFEGIVFDPGFKGASGQVITVHFRAKKIGVAPITLDSGTVLANDGMATEILTGTKKASYSIVAPSAVEVAPSPVVVDPVTTQVNLPAPVIVSDTHPDQDAWYSNGNPHFSWKNDKGVTAVRTLIDRDSNSVPTVVYDPPVEEKQVQDLEDGVWYFHVQSKDENGWGGIAHYAVHIDTEKPHDLTITEIEKIDTTTPTAGFTLNAQDEVSGIDYYEIEVGGETVTWKPGREAFITSVLEPGEYTLNVKVFDQAGNVTGGWAKFTIEGIPTPTVDGTVTEITAGESFEIRGKVTQGTQVVYAYITDRFGEVYEFSTSDIAQDGSFVLMVQGTLSPGEYVVTLVAEDGQGARSRESGKLPLTVLIPGLFGLTVMEVLYIICALILLVLVLFTLLIFRHRKTEHLIKHLGKGVDEMDKSVVKAAALLKSDISKQVDDIKNKRSSGKLTKTERDLVVTMQQDMADLERYLKKQITEVEELLGKEEEKEG